jgi:hypothetical protein
LWEVRTQLGVPDRATGRHQITDEIGSPSVLETGVPHAPQPAADDEVAAVQRHRMHQETRVDLGLLHELVDLDGAGGFQGELSSASTYGTGQWTYSIDPAVLASLPAGQVITEIYQVSFDDGAGIRRNRRTST